jgi:hypothetical protein
VKPLPFTGSQNDCPDFILRIRLASFLMANVMMAIVLMANVLMDWVRHAHDSLLTPLSR